jgi:protease-4
MVFSVMTATRGATMRGEPTDSESPPSTPSQAGEPGAHGVMLELVRELKRQSNSSAEERKLAAAERRSEHRWKMVFQVLVFGVPVVLGVFYFLFFLSSTGFRWGPFGDVVGVVRIEGAIGSGERASAETIVPLLDKAFRNPSVKAVVLQIDSPGGAHVEAERIYAAIGALKTKHPKPVVAVINNLGASAAFMVALHADKIVAGRYSLVGSIGAIMSPWELDRALARFDVRQRVYASGKMKEFLNPFTPVSPEVDAKAHELVNHFGAAFLAEVHARRGSRLKVGTDFGTGEVWPGEQAQHLGLIDEIGTLDQYVGSQWNLETYDFGPAPQSTGLWGSAVQDVLVGAIQRLLMSTPAIR